MMQEAQSSEQATDRKDDTSVAPATEVSTTTEPAVAATSAAPVVAASSIGANESSGPEAAAGETPPSRIQKIRACLNSYGYVGAIAAAIALVFILVAIQPWKALPPPTEDAMVSAWNQSVRKLGIRPLFPPQEDFNVGDILAVVAAYDETPGNPREIGPDGSIVGKSVRIGRSQPEGVGVPTEPTPYFFATPSWKKTGRSSLNNRQSPPTRPPARSTYPTCRSRNSMWQAKQRAMPLSPNSALRGPRLRLSFSTSQSPRPMGCQ